MADGGRSRSSLQLVDVHRGTEDMVGVDVAQRPGHAAITALFLRRLEFVLVAFDQQAEELAAGMALRVPLDAEMQHSPCLVDADQPVGEVLQVHALGELLQTGQGNGDNVVFRAIDRLFQLYLHAVGRDVASPT